VQATSEGGAAVAAAAAAAPQVFQDFRLHHLAC
jgi:hypothetical protein